MDVRSVLSVCCCISDCLEINRGHDSTPYTSDLNLVLVRPNPEQHH